MEPDDWSIMTLHKNFQTIEERDEFLAHFDLTSSDVVAISFQDERGQCVEVRSRDRNVLVLLDPLGKWQIKQWWDKEGPEQARLAELSSK